MLGSYDPVMRYSLTQCCWVLIRGFVLLVALMFAPRFIPRLKQTAKVTRTTTIAVLTNLPSKIQDLPMPASFEHAAKRAAVQLKNRANAIAGGAAKPLPPSRNSEVHPREETKPLDFFSQEDWSELRDQGQVAQGLPIKIYIQDGTGLWWDALRQLPGRRLAFLGPGDIPEKPRLIYDPGLQLFQPAGVVGSYLPLELADPQHDAALHDLLIEASNRLRTDPAAVRVVVLWLTGDRDAWLGLVLRYAQDHSIDPQRISGAHVALHQPLKFSIQELELR